MSARTPRRGANRIVIAPLRKKVELDPQFANKTWLTLQHAIREINRRHTSDLSYEQLYRYGYNMVLHKHGDFLYEGLTSMLSEHLREVADTIRTSSPDNFLQEVRTQWGWFELSLGHVRDVLMYMDRTYVKVKQKKNVNDLGISLFRDIVICDDRILPTLVESVLGKIESERNGESVDPALIRAITRMLAELGIDDYGENVYEKVFEREFLSRTRQFYAREAQLYLAESTCSDYLRKASSRIREEKNRVESYLEPQTEPKVRLVAETELISRYTHVLIDMNGSGLIWMLRNDKVYDLRLMHVLFRNVREGEEVLRTTLKREVLERGTAIVKDPQLSADATALVTAVLALREKYDRILALSFSAPPSIHACDAADWASFPSSSVPCAVGSTISRSSMTIDHADHDQSFHPSSSVAVSNLQLTSGRTITTAGSQSAQLIPDKRFVQAVNDAFERFINSFNQAAEYVSLYVDKLLRKEFRGSNDEEVETKLDAVMTLFRYLHDKDVFERYFKNHLSKRLLDSKSSSSDAEQSFISKIKNECGYLYTSKMEVMFLDIRKSAESTAQFKEWLRIQNCDLKGIDFNPSILTTMSWPTSTIPLCNLPENARYACSKFEEFYLNKHEGRRLTWQTFMGTADLCGRFGDGTRVVDLVVQSHAMCVLMLFNDHDSLTYKEVRDATRIQEQELKRNLQSLSLAKYKVLIKQPATKEVNDTDVFSFNNNFTCRNRRIKIQMIAAPRQTEEIQSDIRARIDDDRKPLIEAAIVRIMKQRKVLEHNKLIIEVTNQLSARFQPNPQDIKRRIESLVEREFLERKEDQRQVYQYVA